MNEAKNEENAQLVQQILSIVHMKRACRYVVYEKLIENDRIR